MASRPTRTPSIWMSCSPEAASSSDRALSPVRRNFTTLETEADVIGMARVPTRWPCCGAFPPEAGIVSERLLPTPGSSSSSLCCGESRSPSSPGLYTHLKQLSQLGMWHTRCPPCLPGQRCVAEPGRPVPLQETSTCVPYTEVVPSYRYKVMKNWGVIGGIAAALAAGIYVIWGPITERKKRRKGLVPGLVNLGNTCFMNSLLQGLSACPAFVKWLEEFTTQYSRDQQGPHTHQCLSLTLLNLLKALSCQEVTEDEVLDASCLLDVLRMYRWQISSFEEQDAHELFHVITSSLEDERDRQPRVTHLFDVHSLEQQSEMAPRQVTCHTRGSPHPTTNHWKSQHPFHGRLTSNMVCKHCEHQSPVRFDTFDSLSLSIPAATWGHPLTLDHCLHHFISSESVRDVVCDNCTKIEARGTLTGEKVEHQRSTFVKQLKLGKLPQCLCIHLQRLSWSSHGTPLKRHEHVQFNEFLMMDFYKYRLLGHKPSQHGPKATENPGSAPEVQDAQAAPKPGLSQPGAPKTQIFLNGACSPSLLPALPSPVAFPLPVVPDYSSSTYLFRLMAVVVHHGDMHSGHFVTYRRSPPSAKNPLSTSNQWLWISDDTVRKASLQEVLSSSAYLLFYERVLSRVQQQGREYRSEE